MTTRLPDGSALPATRGELLARQAERLTALGSRSGLARRWLVGAAFVALGLVGAGVLYAGLGSEGGGRIVGVVIAMVLVGAAAAGLLRLALRGARRRTELAAWSTADRTLAARRLPPGELRLEDATLFDLRDRPEFADAALRVAARRKGGVNTVPVLTAAVVAGLLLGTGLLPLVGLIDSDTTTAGRVACAVVLALLWVPAVGLLAGSVRDNRLGDAAGRHAGTELEAYRLRRRLTHGEQPPKVAGGGLGPGLGSGLLALLLVGYLVVRLTVSSSLAVAITGAITLVLLVVVAVAVVVARRRAARVHVVPFRTAGDEPATALTTPAGEVTLDWTGEALRITRAGATPVDLPAADVLGVPPMSSPGWGTQAVTVATSDDVVVLAGADIEQHPAILELTRAVDSHPAEG